MKNMYPREDIEKSFEDFLKQMSDNLAPNTPEYRRVTEERKAARDEVLKLVPMECLGKVKDALERYDEIGNHRASIELQHTYSTAFTEAFTVFAYLLGSDGPGKPTHRGPNAA